MDAAIKAHPDALQPRLIRAEYLLRLGQPDRAQVLLEQIQSRYPRQPELLVLLAQAQLDNGQTRLALNTAQTLAAAAPGSAEAHYLLALAQGENGDARNMRKSLEQALAKDPGYPPARQAEVKLLALEKKYPEADAALNRLLREHPDDPDILNLKGWYAMLRGKPQEAAEAYRGVLARAAGSRAAAQLAQALWQAGDQAGAIKTLEDWATGHPDDSLSRYLLAGLYRAAQRPGDAQRLLQRVLDISPNNVLALNDLAWLLRKTDPKRALELAERAVQKTPNSPAILDTLATVLMEQGQDGEAVQVLRRAVQLDPGNPSLAFRLAQALNKTGRTEDSVKAVKALLSDGHAFPERQEALELLKRMTAQAGG
jgi:putative PEP-CTERM system TPR-repeat lipoprotein